jgi:translation initiation factor IF-2
MGKLNVTQFATELGLPVALLLEQLKAAGIAKEQESDPLSEKDKAKLLEHLRQAHGAEKPAKKITLIRRETSEIKKADSTGRARTIQVEVRKRRVVAPTAPVEAAPAAPV